MSFLSKQSREARYFLSHLDDMEVKGIDDNHKVISLGHKNKIVKIKYNLIDTDFGGLGLCWSGNKKLIKNDKFVQVLMEQLRVYNVPESIASNVKVWKQLGLDENEEHTWYSLEDILFFPSDVMPIARQKTRSVSE